jgi:hypothetical protein
LRAGWLDPLAGADLLGRAFQISPASAEVEALARDYMAIRIWSAPAIIASYGITGWLIAQERTGAVLAMQVMNGLNIVLDLWFVLGLGWGVEGVALPPSSPNGRAWRWACGSAARPSPCPRGATGRGSSTGRGWCAWRRSTPIS